MNDIVVPSEGLSQTKKSAGSLDAADARSFSVASSEANCAESLDPAVTGNERDATSEANAQALVELLNEIALGQYIKTLMEQGYGTIAKV
jgi:hypothetical protein